MSVQQYPFLCAPVCCRSLDLCSSFLILALRHAAVIFLHHQTSDFSLPLLSPSCRTLATSLLGQARIIWAVLFALWSTLLKISQLLWNILQRSYSVYGDLSWFQLYFQILFSGCCCWLFSPPPPPRHMYHISSQQNCNSPKAEPTLLFNRLYSYSTSYWLLENSGELPCNMYWINAK